MIIWQVSAHDTQSRFWWFATKAEAQRHARDYKCELENEGSDGDGTVEVSSVTVVPTRKGIAEAMNFVINMTCYNEG